MRLHGKADIHMHTTCSDGLMTPEALVEFAAARTDLDVIAITDHDTLEGGQIAQDYAQTFAADLRGLQVVVGVEVTSAEGEIIGLFMQRDIPRGLSAAETIHRIHAQGGLAIAAHPYAHILAWVGKSGMRGVGQLIETLPLDGVEVRNATPTEFWANPRARRGNRRGANLPETGGSDAHYLPTVGSAYTRFAGTTAEDLRRAIQTGQTAAGGRIYNPLLIFNLFWDMATRRAPARQLPSQRAAVWRRYARPAQPLPHDDHLTAGV